MMRVVTEPTPPATEPAPPPTPQVDAPPADYHRTKSRSFWPDPDEYTDAKKTLDEHGRYVSDYLRACLRWLNATPTDALETLREHWPPPRQPGRPRRRASDEPTSDDQAGDGRG